MTSRKKLRPILAWAGVVDGKLDLALWINAPGEFITFATKKLARERYERVARVKITPIPARKR